LQRHVDKNSSNLKDKSTDRKTCVHEIENSHLLLSRNQMFWCNCYVATRCNSLWNFRSQFCCLYDCSAHF
jgi:hypothetical protein